MPAKKISNYERHSIVSNILTIILTVVLTVSSTLMVTSAFQLEATFSILAVSTAVFAILFTLAHSMAIALDLKFLSPAILILTVFLSILMIAADFYYSQEAFRTLLFCIAEYSFPRIEVDPTAAYIGSDSVTPMFNIINLIPMAYTTYFLTYKKIPALSLLFYLPYFLCASTNYVMTPDAVHVEFAAAAVIVLLVVHVTRKNANYALDRSILKLSAVVLLITIALGFIYPDDFEYNKDNLANNTIYTIRDVVLRSPLGSNEFVRNLIDTAAEGRQNIRPEEHADPIDDATSISVTDTDLATTGHRITHNNPVCTITLTSLNHPATVLPLYNVDYLYLKVDSKDTYNDYSWSTQDYDGRAFNPGTYFTEHTGLYSVYIDYVASSSVQLTPYYSDFYVADGGSNVSANSSDFRNPFCSTAQTGTTHFAISTLPERRSSEYSDEYLQDYVYGTNLEVPESTRQEIIDTGLLPAWYMGLLDGSVEMSDADKIRLVTEYVRNLHPYNMNTDYPDTGKDFVAWFIADSDTGFCVHYATTATILLRMVGVPARYTEGYLANVGAANVVRTVTEESSHAWLEVFLPEFGWIIADPTPGNIDAVRNFDIDAIAALYPEYGPYFDPDSVPDTTDETTPNDTSSTDESTSETDTTTNASGGTTSVPTTTASVETSADIHASGEDTSATAGDEIGERTHKGLHFGALSVIILIIISLISIMIIIRMIHVIYWKRRFSAPDIRERIIAYYQYYKVINRFLRRKPAGKAKVIAEKAAFSNDPVTDEELNQLIVSSSRAVESAVRKLPAYKKFFYCLIAIRIR